MTELREELPRKVDAAIFKGRACNKCWEGAK